MTSKAGVSYTYPASSAGSVRPHAVRRVSGSGGSAKAVTIRAKGAESGGVWPTMKLYVNAEYRTEWTVNTSSYLENSPEQVRDSGVLSLLRHFHPSWRPTGHGNYSDYTTTTTLSGDDQIDAVFTNDSGSRDLYVD